MAKGGILIEALAPADDVDQDAPERTSAPTRDHEALISSIESRLAELRQLVSELG